MYDNQGFEPLRKIITKRLVRRGIPAKPEQIIITTGSQQAIDIVCRALKNKTIATENQGFY
ncbi:MAG: hypothetical protein ACK5P5_00240 [Pseudobdellovibrionaceae bacterium]